MNTLHLFLLGVFLGLLHALDPDHLAAVSTFVSRRPDKKSSARFAVEWAMGHSVGLLLLTLGVLAFGKGISAFAQRALESAVGIVLIGLGLWGLIDFVWERSRIHRHPHQDDAHDHFHAHGGMGQDRHDHPHVAAWIGVLHGAAGTARFLVLIPIAFLGSAGACLLYVLFFSLGVLMSMLTYAVVLGHVFERSQSRATFLQLLYRPLAAGVSLLIGWYWLALG